MNTHELVETHHQSRLAMVYVRQSSPHQALSNQESLRLQYALRERALELGWQADDIRVIDSDLGHTASTVEGREGFHELVSLVTLDRVGIIFAYDATRLARNCSDWYPLLDLCGYRRCLIGDRDGLYDPGSINGRLLLGLKGQISELELHTIRARLTAGILNKAQRGELALTLPVGLIREPTGQVVKHPNWEVQDRIAFVFSSFLRLKATTKVVREFNGQGLLIPRRDSVGDVHWRQANTASIGSMLKNPAYAGTFVYGRTRTVRSDFSKKPQQKPRPQNEWRFCIRDKYPAYISWETYERIQAMLQDNHTEYDRNKTRGVPRPGKALLHGLVYCGQCGHKLVVQYKGGTRYLCNHLRQQYQVPVCQHIPADPIDDYVVGQFFAALSVAEIDLYAKAVASVDQQREVARRARQQQVERLRYQARLAQRQFDKADPDNRLVTAELEHRWEEALRQLKAAEEALEQDESPQPPAASLPLEWQEALKEFGERLPDLWCQEIFTQAQRKALLRCLIDKVVIHRVGRDQVHTRIVWRGGDTTTRDVPIPVGSFAELSFAEDMEAKILKMARQGKTDSEMADHLTLNGYRSPLRPFVLPSTVKTIRLRHRMLAKRHQSHPRRIPGHLTVPQSADQLDIPRHWIYDRIHNGTITVRKDARTGCFLFPDKPDLLSKFRQLYCGEIRHLGC
jgi:DNA invertase Pin-like site-specific DNA recombinase